MSFHKAQEHKLSEGCKYTSTFVKSKILAWKNISHPSGAFATHGQFRDHSEQLQDSQKPGGTGLDQAHLVNNQPWKYKTPKQPGKGLKGRFIFYTWFALSPLGPSRGTPPKTFISSFFISHAPAFWVAKSRGNRFS